jgi:hypothetical protein
MVTTIRKLYKNMSGFRLCPAFGCPVFKLLLYIVNNLRKQKNAIEIATGNILWQHTFDEDLRSQQVFQSSTWTSRHDL